MNLRIEAKRIYSWNQNEKCNDCDGIGHVAVKYPKFKAIAVCYDCYDKYYEERVES